MADTTQTNESSFITYDEPAPTGEAHPEDRHLRERSKSLMEDAFDAFVDRANDAGARTMKAMGAQLENIARRIEPEQSIEAEPAEAADRSRKVARSLTGAARYLETNDPKSVFVEVDRSIQKHPYRALGVCFGVGWLVGRIARRS